jgi:hypothetical protein
MKKGVISDEKQDRYEAPAPREKTEVARRRQSAATIVLLLERARPCAQQRCLGDDRGAEGRATAARAD